MFTRRAHSLIVRMAVRCTALTPGQTGQMARGLTYCSHSTQNKSLLLYQTVEGQVVTGILILRLFYFAMGLFKKEDICIKHTNCMRAL